MISDLMLYGFKVALLIGLAALAFERVAAWRGLPRRGLWAAALLLSVALPALSVLAPKQAMAPPAFVANPPPSSAAAPNAVAQVFRAPDGAPSVAIKPLPRQRHTTWPIRASIEPILRSLWFAASAGLVTFYALLWLRLRVAARDWRRERIDDQEVWVTEALGPAVYGFIKPIILIPRWALDAPSGTRAVVLAHEQAHIAASDPTLLLLGLILVVIAPWNLPLWWQLRRLRFAIEVDCDARVLNRGAEPGTYGEVLLAIGERRTFTPVGAIALTEPASQLRRRIQIMTAHLPKRGKWAIVAAIGVSLSCLAVAAELQAPTLRTSVVSGEASVDALRKLPIGEDPRMAEVRNLVRVTYPELFNASASPGAVLVTLLMNQDGTLYKSYKENIEPRPWITTSYQAFDALGVDYEHRGDSVKDRMQGWPAAGNHVDVRAWYFKTAADPSRDVATVRAKVKARFASLFEPRHSDGLRLVREGGTLLTVFMTETGDIDRVKIDVSTDVNVDPKTLATPEHFVAMGIASERIGPIGTTELYAGHYNDDRDMKSLRVIYAWPRRPNEPAPQPAPPEQPATAGANDDPAVNRTIAEHYFPDLYTYPKEWPRADPWVLLDRQGKVLTTGRRVVMSGRDIQLNIESLYPGIRTDGVQVTTIHGEHGQSADVGFVWLAADSPVSDPSKADLSARNALLLYADVIGEGMTRPSEWLALKAGLPAVTACSLKNPFVVHVQVTAVEVGADAVAVRVRVQHVPLPTTAEIPTALETAWSQESAPVRAPYGGSADVQVTDQNGKTWKIVLHPERLMGSRM